MEGNISVVGRNNFRIILVCVLLVCFFKLSAASNFQPVIVSKNFTFQNLTICVCSTDTECCDLWMQNFFYADYSKERVVVLDGFNSSLNQEYFFSAYTDNGVLLEGSTQSYLGRGDVFLGNYNITGNLSVGGLVRSPVVRSPDFRSFDNEPMNIRTVGTAISQDLNISTESHSVGTGNIRTFTGNANSGLSGNVYADAGFGQFGGGNIYYTAHGAYYGGAKIYFTANDVTNIYGTQYGELLFSGIATFDDALTAHDIYGYSFYPLADNDGFSLGSSTMRFTDLWLGQTAHIGTMNISSGSIKDNTGLITTDSLNITGNATAHYYFGSGKHLTELPNGFDNTSNILMGNGSNITTNNLNVNSINITKNITAQALEIITECLNCDIAFKISQGSTNREIMRYVANTTSIQGFNSIANGSRTVVIGSGGVSTGSGGVVIGFANNRTTDKLMSTGSCMVIGFSAAGGNIRCDNGGSIAEGYSIGLSTSSNILSNETGSKASGAAFGAPTGTGSGNIQALNIGSEATGYAIAKVTSWPTSVSGTIKSSGLGSIAKGYAIGKTLGAYGTGSVALGSAIAGNVKAIGTNSFAFGDDIEAQQTLSIALGYGFDNNITNSFMVGFSSIPALVVENARTNITGDLITTRGGNFTTNNINASGVINSVQNYSINGVIGLTQVVQVGNSTNTGNCSLTFTGGILTATNCV